MSSTKVDIFHGARSSQLEAHIVSLAPAAEEPAASVAASEQPDAADAEPWLINVTDAEILAQVIVDAEDKVEDYDVHPILPHVLAHEHVGVDMYEALSPTVCEEKH